MIRAALIAFRRWRFKPGSVSKVRIPITFTTTGAQYLKGLTAPQPSISRSTASDHWPVTRSFRLH